MQHAVNSAAFSEQCSVQCSVQGSAPSTVHSAVCSAVCSAVQCAAYSAVHRAQCSVQCSAVHHLWPRLELKSRQGFRNMEIKFQSRVGENKKKYISTTNYCIFTGYISIA